MPLNQNQQHLKEIIMKAIILSLILMALLGCKSTTIYVDGKGNEINVHQSGSDVDADSNLGLK